MRLLTILFTLCLVPALLHTAKGQGFSVSPAKIFFSGNPGETVSQNITFSNTSKSPLSFITRIQDFDRDSLGNKMYYPTGSQPLSNGKWLSLSSNNILLAPGEEKQVIVSMGIPPDADKLTNSMIFFTQVKEQLPQQAKAVSVGINVLMEVGVQVYYAPKGLSPGELELVSFDDHGIVENAKKKARRMALKVHNTGAVNKDVNIRYELTNKETGEEIKLDPETIALLPNATQVVMLNLPADLKGKFLVVALLDAGPSYDLKVAEKEIIYRP